MKQSRQYWLVKSEADCYSIDDLKADKKTAWTGIRNYQARNFIRDGMKESDLVLFYHSGSDPLAVVGVAKVVREAYGDFTALKKKDVHYDPKSTKENPIWFCVDLAFVGKFKQPVTLSQIKFNPELRDMAVAKQGTRLSVLPVSEKHFKIVLDLGK